MKDRQFGDFQTPIALVNSIIKALGPIGKRWGRVLEPTCGDGSFIRGIIESESPPREIIGIEAQKHHVDVAEQIKALDGSSISILHRDIFNTSLSKDIKWKTQEKLLVIGNPPWVTNSEIGALNGYNLPHKTNFKKLRGIDAITGKSNFDITEYIWIKLIIDLVDTGATMALLCKTAVARNVLQFAEKNRLPVSGAEIRLIDAMKWFGAAVDACLFILQVGTHDADYQTSVFNSLDDIFPSKRIGFINGQFISNVEDYAKVAFIEGKCQLQWRQGIKHDLAAIMELEKKANEWHNGLGEYVDIEDEFIYPLIKGSEFGKKSGDIGFKRAVVVPQKSIRQNTERLSQTAPKLWAYLHSHKKALDLRKSSIYKNRPPFSVFGVGDYSFSKHKVFASGLHKNPRFLAAGLIDEKPVFCDDTCYFLACASGEQASIVAALLNHPLSISFINSIMFKDSKRPITKGLLSRIDLLKLSENIPIGDIRQLFTLNFEFKNVLSSIEPKRLDIIHALNLDNRATQQALF